MRSHDEVLQALLTYAREDDRIRAMLLAGSRVDPHAKADIFQDYDIACMVEDTAPFRKDRRFMERFGQILLMQYPEENPYYPSEPEQEYGWLALYRDGIRIDFHVCRLPDLPKDVQDGMYTVLLDKDGLLPPPPAPDGHAFFIRRPTAAQFTATCNEFWWSMSNVAKGLWRGEPTYALELTNSIARPMLRRVLEWRVGLENGFAVSAGKAGKALPKYLPPALWQEYLSTYSPAEEEALWRACLLMAELFATQAQLVGQRLGYPYNIEEALNGKRHLEHVHTLPKEADGVY